MQTAVQKRFQDTNGFSNNKTIKGKQLPLPPICPGQEQYLFHEEDSAENILFTGEMVGDRPIIKGGTIEKLVERLTYAKYPDPEFTKTFLLTYRSFTTPKKLLNILIGRYHVKPKPEEEFTEIWANTVKKPVQLRVFNVLKNWLLHGFYDFSDNPKLNSNFLTFITEDMSVDLSSAASTLRKVYDRQMQERQNKNFILNKKPPKAILPKAMPETFNILDFNPEEIARQLTLIESELYRAIQPWEFLNQAWAKKDKQKRAPRVIAMINRFNQVSNWAASTILSTESLRTRISVLKHMIEIASKCMALNNFNAVTEIVSGLHTSSVYRLKQTWGSIGSKHTKMLEDCQTIMSRDQNYKNFRAYLHSVDPPVIPYLGVYLTDLTFIEDGNGDLFSGKLINFVKRQHVSQVIGEIQQYQNDLYALEPVTILKQWLNDVTYFEEDEMFDISLSLEARGGGKLKKAKSGKKPVDPRTFSIYGELEDITGYLFYDTDTKQNIEIHETAEGKKVSICAGTLPKLVERLTFETYPDPNYVAAFLMTFRSFTTPSTLLDLLIMRFNMPKPKSPTKEQQKQFAQEKMIPIHFRVFNVLKLWAERYYSDFKEDTVLVQRVIEFIEPIIQNNKTLHTAGQAIITILSRTEYIATPRYRFLELGSQSTLDTNPSTNPISWNILEFNVKLLAEQIFYNTYRIFTALEPRECLQPRWTTKSGSAVAPRLYLMLANSRALTRWVKAEIYWTSDIRVRVKTTGFFLELAQAFVRLGDFHDCFIILKVMEALTTYSEFDLVWDWLDLKHVRIWNDIKDTNPRGTFKNDDTRHGNEKPQIPYYEPELVQFSDIMEHISDSTPSGLINFEKRMNIHSTYSFLQRAKMRCNEVPDIQGNEEVIKFLMKIPVPSDEQLQFAFQHINNAPPEGISPAEQQRQREAAKNETMIQTTLTKSLQEIFEGDKGFQRIADELFREELLESVTEPIETSLAIFCQLSELLMKVIIDLSNPSVSAQMRVQENVAKIAAIRYPNHKVFSWTQRDDTGNVCGQVGDIKAIVASRSNETIVVEALYSVSASDISYYQRLLDFYGTKENKQPKLGLVTCKIDTKTQQLAKDSGFDVMVL